MGEAEELCALATPSLAKATFCMLAQAETETQSFSMPCAGCNAWVEGWRHYTDAPGQYCDGLGRQIFYCGRCIDNVARFATLDAAGLAAVLEMRNFLV